MKFFHGLKFKVISTIAIILTICLVAVDAYIINDQKVKLMRALRERGEDIANLVSKNAIEPIKNFDDLSLQEAIIRVEQKNEIAYAQIFNTDNEATVTEGMTLDGKETLKKVKPKILPDNILVIKSKVMDEDEHLGTVEIGFYLDEVVKEINKSLIILILGLVGLLATVILIMYVYLSFSIISPVVLLAKAAENLDDESIPIDIKRSDELGILGRKFVEMRDAVRKRVDDLKTMNAKIEQQVKERTAELNAERNNIANLLNNMRQAVFTVSHEGTIMGPVSQFSGEIFGGEVIGTHIFDTIYNNVEEQSELFATIKSVMTCVYGSDDLQWDIMADYLPTRLSYKPEKEDEDYKILKVAYNPLWDTSENLERIMFVVEDITELEKLEKEMAEQKESASKNIQMLQELAAGKKEDLGEFFASANQMTLECQKIAKTMREDISANKEVEGLDLLFRHLHTIKGNSRVFSLSLISKVVHDVESTITGFMDKTIEINEENINQFIQDLYVIQGQINEYTKVAKEVFNFDFGEDSRFKIELFNLTKEFELKVSFLISSHVELHKGRKKEAEKHYKDWVFKNSHLKNLVKDLMRISHSIKGLSRGMDERDLSQVVHQFEMGLSIIEKGEDFDDSKWEDLFLGPLEQIKNMARNVYFHSTIFRGLDNESESWVPLFISAFKLTQAFETITEGTKSDLVNLVYKVKTIGSEKSLDYIPLVMRRMDDLLLEENFNKEEISMCLKELWVFLSFLAAMDSNKYADSEGRKIIRRALSTKAGLRGIPADIGRTIIHLFLNECEGNGIMAHDTLKILNNYIAVEGLEIIDLFVPEADITSSINDFLGGLKKKFAESNLKNFIKKVKKNDISYGSLCELAFASRDLFWFKSTKEIGLLRLLSTYAELDDGAEGGMKPPIIEVLNSNFESFKALLGMDEELESKGIDVIKMRYERLLELPVKYSFNKFRTVVKEVSEGLHKKIKFKLSGDEGSLHRDKLTLLQDSMMHLIRNSLDHGIESPEIRIAKGKPEVGIVEIECNTKDPTNLRIIIRDDGNGIDANKICAKGISQGLITEDEAGKMTESDKLKLIFASTLSTKEEISEISGRGVGMDVVKKNLEEMGSHIEIKTVLGRGTEFIINIAI